MGLQPFQNYLALIIVYCTSLILVLQYFVPFHSTYRFGIYECTHWVQYWHLLCIIFTYLFSLFDVVLHFSPMLYIFTFLASCSCFFFLASMCEQMFALNLCFVFVLIAVHTGKRNVVANKKNDLHWNNLQPNVKWICWFAFHIMGNLTMYWDVRSAKLRPYITQNPVSV